jgi:hypothetical protein
MLCRGLHKSDKFLGFLQAWQAVDHEPFGRTLECLAQVGNFCHKDLDTTELTKRHDKQYNKIVEVRMERKYSQSGQ